MSLKKFSKMAVGLQKIAIVGPFFRRKYLVKCPLYVLVDKGADFHKEIKDLERESIFFKLGDGDSYEGMLDIRLSRNKDFSDLKFALDILPSSVKTLHLLGFVGGRLDHQLFCLGEVHHFLVSKKNTRVLFDDHLFAFSSGRVEQEVFGSFSLAVFSPTKISLNGKCRFSLEKSTVAPLSSLCLGNWGDGLIVIESNGPFFLFINKVRP